MPYGEIGTPYILNENDENYQPFEPNYTYLGTLTNAEKIPSKNHTDYQWLKITGKQVDDGYTDYTNEISFNETQYFSIVEKQMTKQGKTVYLSVNLEGIKAFNLVRNQQIKIGKLTHADVFPTTRVAINFVTISADMAIYANTAMIIEKNGDIVLINTSDVTIGSAFNFKVGNQHLLHLSYVVL